MSRALEDLEQRSSPSKNSWIVGLRLGLPTLGFRSWWGWDWPSLPKIISLKGQSFPSRGGYWPGTSSMIATKMEATEGQLILIAPYFKGHLSLSSFILRNQNLHFCKLFSQLIPGGPWKDPYDRALTAVLGGNAAGGLIPSGIILITGNTSQLPTYELAPIKQSPIYCLIKNFKLSPFFSCDSW